MGISDTCPTTVLCFFFVFFSFFWFRWHIKESSDQFILSLVAAYSQRMDMARSGLILIISLVGGKFLHLILS